jgi:hypothetical protein
MPRGQRKRISKKVPLAAYLPEDLMASLKERAEQEHRSISRQVIMYVEEGLKRKGK